MAIGMVWNADKGLEIVEECQKMSKIQFDLALTGTPCAFWVWCTSWRQAGSVVCKGVGWRNTGETAIHPPACLLCAPGVSNTGLVERTVREREKERERERGERK